MTQWAPEKVFLKSEFEKIAKANNFEVITSAQLQQFTQEAFDTIEKSIEGKHEIAKEAAAEIRSFRPVNIIDDVTFLKSVMFVREAQIAWEESGDDIEKGNKGSKTGFYTDTYLNRKLGRVGRKYKKDGTSEKEEPKEEPKKEDDGFLQRGDKVNVRGSKATVVDYTENGQLRVMIGNEKFTLSKKLTEEAESKVKPKEESAAERTTRLDSEVNETIEAINDFLESEEFEDTPIDKNPITDETISDFLDGDLVGDDAEYVKGKVRAYFDKKEEDDEIDEWVKENLASIKEIMTSNYRGTNMPLKKERIIAALKKVDDMPSQLMDQFKSELDKLGLGEYKKHIRAY